MTRLCQSSEYENIDVRYSNFRSKHFRLKAYYEFYLRICSYNLLNNLLTWRPSKNCLVLRQIWDVHIERQSSLVFLCIIEFPSEDHLPVIVADCVSDIYLWCLPVLDTYSSPSGSNSCDCPSGTDRTPSPCRLSWCRTCRGT